MYKLGTIASRIVEQHEADTDIHICRNEGGEWSFRLPRFTLLLSHEDDILKSEVLDNRNNVRRKTLDLLRQQVRNIVNSANGGKVPKNSDALVIIVFEALAHILDFKVEDDEKPQRVKKSGKWRADERFDYSFYTSNDLGLDVSSVADTASQFLGKTPEQLCENIPHDFRVIHVESILRTDLVHRFQRYQDRLRRELVNESSQKLRHCMPPHSKLAGGRVLSTLSRNDVVEDMLTPRVTYHGTPLWNVGSIVRHGFKMPGTLLDSGRTIASPRSDIAFDRGIYSSQAPFYALSYASSGRQPTPIGEVPTLRLFICATIMGRTLSGNTPEGRSSLIHGHLVDGYDSHFDGSYEYIIHHPAAMLPCYVVHLDLGSEAAKQAIHEAQKNPFAFDQSQKRIYPKLNSRLLAPGDTKRMVEAKKAAALKWFPHGFGTAKGTSFVIEEIGDVDDDEEEYGEWQAERHGFSRDEGSGGWMDAGRFLLPNQYEYDEEGSQILPAQKYILDQYQTERMAFRSKR